MYYKRMTPELLELLKDDWPYSKAKTAVLAAAAGVIRERGPRSATLKNIANRVGITEPAIFRHFDGVDGLFTGLFNTVELAYVWIAKGFDDQLSGWDRVKTATIAMVDLLADSRDLAYVVIFARQVFGGYPDLRERLNELNSENQTQYLSCIKDAVERKEVRADISAETIATALSGLAQMTVAAWITSGFSFDVKTVMRARMDEMEKVFALPGAAKDKKAAARKKSTKANA